MALWAELLGGFTGAGVGRLRWRPASDAAAEQFGVGISFIYKALNRRRVSGETTARAQCNQQALKLAAHHEAIRAEVERAFAKLKALLWQAAERTIDGLWTTSGKLLDCFSPVECQNYIENSGYVRSA